MQPKYIAKVKAQISEFVSIAKYYYADRVTIYVNDTRREQALVINVSHREIELILAKAKKQA